MSVNEGQEEHPDRKKARRLSPEVRLEDCRSAYNQGQLASAYDAVLICNKHRLEMPDWVIEAIRQCFLYCMKERQNPHSDKDKNGSYFKTWEANMKSIAWWRLTVAQLSLMELGEYYRAEYGKPEAGKSKEEAFQRMKKHFPGKETVAREHVKLYLNGTALDVSDTWLRVKFKEVENDFKAGYGAKYRVVTQQAAKDLGLNKELIGLLYGTRQVSLKDLSR